MARGYWLMHVLLVCVWCFLDTRLISSVNAQSVSISKGSPLGNIFEGDRVELRCDARDLMVGYIIEWTRTVIVNSQPVDELITRNGMNLDSRYTLDILLSSAQNKIETLSFTAIKEDTSIYNCVLRASINLNSGIVEKISITLSVNYFPSAMYPICFPDGPFTVHEGTTQHMNCTTERGNPAVQIHILAIGSVYTWVFSAVNDTRTRSLSLPVTAADNGGSYECKIAPNSTIFPNMERSCTIGPITVAAMTTGQTQSSTITPGSSYNVTDTSKEQTPTPSADDTTITASPTSSSLPIVIIAAAAGGGGGILLLLLIILIVLYVCKCCCFTKKHQQKPPSWQAELPLVELTDNQGIEPRGKQDHINQDANSLQEMKEINPSLIFIAVSEVEQPDSPEAEDRGTTAGANALYALPQQKVSTFKEQSKEDIPSHKVVDASDLDASENEGVKTHSKEESNATDEGSTPVYGKVQKSSRASRGGKDQEMTGDTEAEPSTTDLPDRSTEQEYPNPVFTEGDYAIIHTLTDTDQGQKPTAVVKPVAHSPTPTVPSEPGGDIQFPPHISNDGASPSAETKPNIKKFKSKGIPPRPQPNVMPSCTPDDLSSTPSVEQQSTLVEGYDEEEGYAEIHNDYGKPSEVQIPDDHHDIKYAELNLQPPTSDTVLQSQEENTLYASIVSK